MARATPDDVLDAFLEEIALADTLYICSDQPANFAGIAAVALADVALTPGAGSGDFTKANGDVSGRKLTITQQDDMPIDATGEADHVVLALAASSRMLYVTVCAAQNLTSGGTVTNPAWDIELADPAAP